MATLKLIPTSYYYVNTNTYAYKPENALADTTSTTTTSLNGKSGSVEASRWFQLIFGEQIPNNIIIDSVEVKIHGYSQFTSTFYPMSAKINNVVFASGVFDTVDSIITLTPKEEFDIQTLAGTSGALLQIYCVQTNSYVYVKGAEININYHRPINKITYGNETLIDLTSDTATASDVASGKTFHLASGVQATGTLSVKSASSKPTSNSRPQTISFTNLQNEPSWFVLCAANNNNATQSRPAGYIVYNGETTTTFYATSTSSSANVMTYEATSGNAAWTFSYSSGTLTLSSTSNQASPLFNTVRDATLYYI